MLPGWTADALFEEAVVQPRHAYLPVADLVLSERPGWTQIVTPSLPDGGMNEVSLAVLTPDTADAVITATIARYRDARLRFRWIVAPDSAPADLGARLERHGLQPSATVAMAARTDAAGLHRPAPAPRSPAVTVTRVDLTTVDVYTRTMAAGWAIPPGPLLAANRLAVAPGSRFWLYLASVDGEPAGVATQVLFERSAYQLGAVVLPSHRCRGVYAALVTTRLDDARSAGRTLATTHARASTSAPLLARRGFVRVCDLAVYQPA